MTYALYVLWLSGLGLIYLGYIAAPAYIDNQKLWMKVVTVLVLTVNGALMHSFAFPHMLKKTAFLAMPLPTVLGLGLFASISSASWLYASFLGIARAWNNTVPFEYVLSVYGGLLALTAVGSAVLITSLRQYHISGRRLTSSSTVNA